MKTQTVYDEVCDVTELKTGKTVQGETLSFRPQQQLVVTINRSVKLVMMWNAKHQVYQASMAGMEFESAGPNSRVVRTAR